MNLFLIAAACLVPLVWGQLPLCRDLNTQFSPLYNDIGLDRVCTDEMCKEDISLDCTYPELGLELAVYQHTIQNPHENISREIEYLAQYFNLMAPEIEQGGLLYSCPGACSRPVTHLKRVFVDRFDPYTGQVTKTREMCHVIGPKNIYYSACGGRCKLDLIRNSQFEPYFCSPDQTFDMDVWVYCENSMPNCRKERIRLPLSCSCKRYNCLKALPIPGGVDLGSLLGGGTIIGEPAVLKPVKK